MNYIPEFISVTEAAKIIGCNRTFIYKLCEQNEIKYIMKGMREKAINKDFLVEYYLQGRSIDEYNEDYEELKRSRQQEPR